MVGRGKGKKGAGGAAKVSGGGGANVTRGGRANRAEGGVANLSRGGVANRAGGGATLATAPSVLRTANRIAAARKVSPLLNQYNFKPANDTTTDSTQTRLPVVETPVAIGVKDYPPPRHLFQTATSFRGVYPTTTTQPLSSVNHVESQANSQPFPSLPHPRLSPPQPRHSQLQSRKSPSDSLQDTSPPQDPSQLPVHRHSPHSSQAQNDYNEDKEIADEEAEDNGVPIQQTEPTLLEDVFASVNALLLLPDCHKFCDVVSPLLEPDTTWFGYDGSAQTQKISKILKNKFDAPYYSWSCVPRPRQEIYFLEFTKEHTWKPEYTGQVQAKFEEIALLRIKDMFCKAHARGKRLRWIVPTLWDEMTAYSATEEARVRSATPSPARMSERGVLGPHTHIAGQKSFTQV